VSNVLVEILASLVLVGDTAVSFYQLGLLRNRMSQQFGAGCVAINDCCIMLLVRASP